MALKLQLVVIDREYPGHENQIKDIILEYARLESKKKVPEIVFREITKYSPAHDLASATAHKKIKADSVLSLRSLSKLAIKNDRASRRAGPRAT